MVGLLSSLLNPQPQNMAPQPSQPMAGQTQQPRGLLGLGGNLGGIMDFNDPQKLIAMQLIANGQKAPGQMFDGVPELAAYGAKMQAANAEQQQAQQAKNATVEFLKKSDPTLASLVEAGALSPADGYSKWAQKSEPDEFGKRAQAAAQYGLAEGTPEYQQFVLGGRFANEAGSNQELGLNLVYGRDENGNTVAYQASKSGGLVPVEVAPNVQLSDPYSKAADAAAGKVAGEAQATAQAGLSGARRNIDYVKMLVDDIKQDPSLGRVLGPIDSRTPNFSAGANRVQAKIDQLGGQAFLEARQMLKGGGAITDFESKRAEQAYVRLNQAQSEEDFKKALDDFTDALEIGYQKLASQAGAAPSSGRAATPGRRLRFNPQTGDLE